MTDKSYVTLEQQVCLICRKTFDTGTLILDRTLRERFDMHTTTGVGQCDECIHMNNEGYVALVGATGDDLSSDRLKPEDACYTKEYLWLKRHVAEQIINVDLTDWPFCYIEPEAIEKIKGIVARAKVNGSGCSGD